MSLEQQVTALVEASNNLTSAVNGKIQQIDQTVTAAEKKFNDFIAASDSKFQSIIYTAGKYYGSHYIMNVSPPDHVDPAHPNYKPGQRNGVILWRIGDDNDTKRVNSIGLQGNLILTRTGYENFKQGEFRCLRQYSSYYSYIETGLDVAIESMNVDGIDYRVLTCNMGGGGAVVLNGLLAFSGRGSSGDSGTIRDSNFGRYVNTKDGSVYSEYANISSLPYDPE